MGSDRWGFLDADGFNHLNFSPLTITGNRFIGLVNYPMLVSIFSD